ncbi:MAG: amidohydrolase family protein [Anaerolineae bacterium]|jgi:predicted TIM-barrel fold metal-dependent hydrolase|nr:amidohydrolase family protein [Chloroflexota bacterium]
MIIDGHVHIVPPSIVRDRAHYMAADRWFGILHASPRARLVSAEELIHSMDDAEVDAALCFGFAFADNAICRLCNDHVLEAAARWPSRLIPFAVVNPAEEAGLAEAERCLAAGAAGVGELMPDGQGFGLGDPSLEPLLALLQQHAAPLMLHISELVGHQYAGKGTVGPLAAYTLAAAHPELRLILSHWGGGLALYELMPKARPSLANVWYDTAASPLLYEDRIFSEVSLWAPTKIVFGTDYPLLSQKRMVARVRALGLNQEQEEAILATNLLRALGRLQADEVAP